MNTYRCKSRVTICLLTLVFVGSVRADEPKEAELLAVLRSDAPGAEKALVCKNLAIHGSAAAVPDLAKLLPDPQLSSWARIALEVIPGAASNKALRDAAGALEGRLLVGVINSIGVRQDAGAVELLSERLKADDAQVASAAAVALGHIANDASIKALRVALADSPQDIRSAVAEGCVLCAERLLAGGDAGTATAIYDEVRHAELPLQRVIEGTRGAILARGEGGLPLLVEILQSDDKKLFQLALGTVREFSGSAVDKAVAAELVKATPGRAAMMVQALADRSDTVDVSVILKAAEQGDNQVRLSAINALQRVGNDTCLTSLLEIAVSAEPELAAAAQETLAVLPGSSVNGEIGVMLSTATGTTQKLLLDLIGQRRITGEVEAVENLLSSSDASIRSAALVALGETVSLRKLPVLISQVVKPVHAEDVEIAQLALKAASVRMPDREACSQQLSKALLQAPSSAQITLLEILSSVGGKTALQSLATAAMNKDDQLQDTSSRLLGKWNGVEAAPVLLNLARNAPSEKYRVRALRGYIGLARKFAMPETQRAAMCENAVKATNRSSEHKLVLDVLQLHPSAEGLRLAIRIMKNPALKNDASAAAMVIAQKVSGKGVDVNSLMAGVGLDKVKLEIISATYGAGNKTKDVTAHIGKQASDLPLIALASGNYNKSFGGDPAPGVAKQLKIKYRINGKAGEATFAENALIILPTPKS